VTLRVGWLFKFPSPQAWIQRKALNHAQGRQHAGDIAPEMLRTAAKQELGALKCPVAAQQQPPLDQKHRVLVHVLQSPNTCTCSRPSPCIVPLRVDRHGTEQRGVQGISESRQPPRKRKNLSLSLSNARKASRTSSSSATYQSPDKENCINQSALCDTSQTSAIPVSTGTQLEASPWTEAQSASAAVAVRKQRQQLPPSYAPVLHIPKEVRTVLRLRVSSDLLGLRRGTLSAGWRPLVKMKKLRREYLKAERNVSTAVDPETKLYVKRTALFKASQVVPNLKSLEALLFTAFVEFDVKKAVWPLLDTKTFHTSVRALSEHGNRGIGQAHTSRFQIMVCGPDYVVCDCGRPREFASWEDMLSRSGGLDFIVHEETLRNELKLSQSVPITPEIMAEYCRPRGSPASPVTGFCGFHIRKRLFPWQGQDMAAHVIERNFARLRACMATLENVWTRVGLWTEVLAPFPAGWQGGTPNEKDA
jgi:hypothetical protein